MPASAAVPVLTADRVRLRPLRSADARSLRLCFKDAGAEKYWHSIGGGSDGGLEAWIETQNADPSPPEGRVAWAVAEKVSDLCIGIASRHHHEVADARLEIGYILAPEYRGRGLMTEAVTLLLRHCFEDLAVHRVEALIHPDNQPSIRLASRLGFRCEGGPLRDYWKIGEQYFSLMVYGLLSQEWASAQGR